MIDWMELQEIEQLILTLRKRESNDVKSKYIQLNIQLAIRKINQLKQECLQNIRLKSLNLTESVLHILKTEAQIINIIGIMIYSDFTCHDTLDTYLKRESLYAYQEYLEDIKHYADDYQKIGILPHFYMKTVARIEK
ncbi:hypothetical protein E1H99_06745 [Enterococcus hirae]|nr:hypothetical protein E1H99_06745 [Enterococcus hirae]